MLHVKQGHMYPLQSDEIDKLMSALAQVHKNHGIVIGKDAKGHKGTYAKQDTILSTIHERCEPVGLILTRKPITKEDGSQFLETMLFHIPSKQWIKCISRLYISDNSPNPDQAYGSSSTYHSRYDALALTGMCAADDPSDHDGERSEQAHSASSYCLSEKQQAYLRSLLSQDQSLARKVAEEFGFTRIIDVPPAQFNDILAFIKQHKGS